MVEQTGAAAEAPRGGGASIAGTAKRLRLRRFLLAGLLLMVAGAVPAWKRGWYAYSMAKARERIAHKDFDQAVELLNRAERLWRGQPQTAYWTAVAYRRAGRIEHVAAHLQAAQERGWPQEEIFRQQLLLKAEVGRFNEVEPQLRELLLQGLDDEAAREVYEALVNGYWANRQAREALDCLGSWINWRSQDIAPRLMRAHIYTVYSDAVAAEKEYRAILEIDPDHLRTRSRLGMTLLQRGDPEGALGEFRYCLDRGRRTDQVLAGMAECEYRLGRAANADHWLDQIDFAALEPERRANLIKMRADIARLRRDHPAAVRLLTEAAKIWPHDAGIFEALAQSNAALGDSEAAERYLAMSREVVARSERYYALQRKVFYNPTNPDLRCQVAEVLWEQGLRDDAASWWRSAIQCDPNHRQSRERLAQYYAQKGDVRISNPQR